MDTPHQQMLLDLKPEQPPTLDNFVIGTNAELVERLRGLADIGNFEALYLWGNPGCGKSHLLAATAASAHSRRPLVCLHGADAPEDLALAPGSLLVIDDMRRVFSASPSSWREMSRPCASTCAKTCEPASARP